MNQIKELLKEAMIIENPDKLKICCHLISCESHQILLVRKFDDGDDISIDNKQLLQKGQCMCILRFLFKHT